jgi:lactoylglutathione lyase
MLVSRLLPISATRVRLLSAAAAPRFRVLGLQQVAIGGLDKQALKDLWQGVCATCVRERTRAASLGHRPTLASPRAPFALPAGVFGVTQTGTFRSEKENVDEDILRLGSGPLAVEIDLMQPIDASRPPKVHEPALNHIGLWVHPLREAVAALEEQGVRFTPGGIRVGAAGYEVAFIHPKGNAERPQGGCGVLIELVQPPPEVIAAFAKAEGG